jgi:hypothetical protein
MSDDINTKRQLFIPHARRAIIMALSQEDGWKEACREWLLDYDLIGLQNAIDLEMGEDNRFTHGRT